MKSRAVIVCIVLVMCLLLVAGCTNSAGSSGTAKPTKTPAPVSLNLSTIKPDLNLLTQKIQSQNEYNKAHNYAWTAGVTSISTMSDAQKKNIHGKKKPTKKMAGGDAEAVTVPTSLPESFDWRDHDGDWTTPIKDQNSIGDGCGSCWAHAEIAVLESYMERKNHDASSNPDLSEQYLISCNGQGNGCDGGDFSSSMPFIVSKPGLTGGVGPVSFKEYPYEGADSQCKDLTGTTRYAAEHWSWVEPNPPDGTDPESYVPTVEKLKAAIYEKGPLVVAMACPDNYDDYVGGIFEYDTGDASTDHAVVLTGWGTENGKQYFIGKNSWGTNWGEKGWFKINVNSGRIGEGAAYISEK